MLASSPIVVSIKTEQKIQVPITENVIATFISVASAPQGSGSYVAQFRVITSLALNPKTNQWNKGDILHLPLVPNESRIPIVQQVNDEYAGKLVFAQVEKIGNEIRFNRQWLFEAKNVQETVIREKSGINSVNEINAMPTDRERVAAFSLATHTTVYPSLTLITEALVLAHPELPDVQRLELVKGLIEVFSRAGTPMYVRESAFYIADSFKLVNDIQERDRELTVTRCLLTSFHAVANGSNSELQEFILKALSYNLSNVVANPQLRSLVTDFSKDLQNFERQRLNQEGNGVVTVTPFSMNGIKGYTYSGTVDKVKTEELVRPFWDILSERDNK